MIYIVCGADHIFIQQIKENEMHRLRFLKYKNKN